jgi:hypothetical protein
MNALLNACITVKKRQKSYWCMAAEQIIIICYVATKA